MFDLTSIGFTFDSNVEGEDRYVSSTSSLVIKAMSGGRTRVTVRSLANPKRYGSTQGFPKAKKGMLGLVKRALLIRNK